MVLFSNLDRAKKRAQKGCRLNDTNFFSFSGDHKSQKGGVSMRLAHHLPFTWKAKKELSNTAAAQPLHPLIEFKIEKKKLKQIVIRISMQRLLSKLRRVLFEGWSWYHFSMG